MARVVGDGLQHDISVPVGLQAEQDARDRAKGFDPNKDPKIEVSGLLRRGKSSRLASQHQPDRRHNGVEVHGHAAAVCCLHHRGTPTRHSS
jgi:hypothetical protein